MEKCIKCGAELLDGSVYCHICGKKQVREPRKALKRANGMGTVYKLQGRRRRPWVATKNKIIIGYYEKKTEALEALEAMAGKSLTDRYNMTFLEVFNEWSTEHYKDIGERGRKAYDNAHKIFSDLDNRIFRMLRTSDFQNIMDLHLSKSRSATSVYRLLLTQMYEWAIREEICTSNFAKYIKISERKPKEKEIFTQEEIRKIENDPSETARIVTMLLTTGMRIGELFSAKLSDYHGTYLIGGSKTDAGKNRIIPIRPEGRQHFQYFAQIATDNTLLSGFRCHKSTTHFTQDYYYPLLDRLGIPRRSPHTTRHTYASLAVKNGMKPEILKSILGHANYSTTINTYTHIDTETLISAVECL